MSRLDQGDDADVALFCWAGLRSLNDGHVFVKDCRWRPNLIEDQEYRVSAMSKNAPVPKVFISYCWRNEETRDWVLEFAERLQAEGVETVLDRWYLKEGQDKNAFMERMVTDPTVTRVLCICDRAYQEKANARQGGVGTESTIISEEVYRQVNQGKFLPIAREFDESGEPYLPVFFKSRIYIDLSEGDRQESEHEKLLRNIFHRPAHSPPPLGTPPAYITDEGSSRLRTAHHLKRIRDAVIGGKPHAGGLIDEYFESFVESMEDLRVTLGPDDADALDEPVVKSIERSRAHRDDFIDTLLFLIRYAPQPEVMARVEDAFERMAPYQYSENQGTFESAATDVFKFFLYELFLYTIASLVRAKQYDSISRLSGRTYHFPYGIGNRYFDQGDASVFNIQAGVLDGTRNRRLGLGKASVMALLVNERSTRTDIRFIDVLQADALLFARACLAPTRSFWEPRCFVYSEGGVFDLFARATSEPGRTALLASLGCGSLRDVAAVMNTPGAKELARRYFRMPYILSGMMNLEEIGRAAIREGR